MGQSFFSSSVEIPGSMRPFVALTFVMGCAYGAPADVAVAGTYAGLGLAGVHGLGYAAAPLAGVAPVAAAAAPIAYGAEHYSAGPVVAPVAYAEPAAPAPYTTATQAAGVTTVPPARPCGHQAGAPWPDQLCVRICHQDPQASHSSSSYRCPNCPQGNPGRQRPHCQDPD